MGRLSSIIAVDQMCKHKVPYKWKREAADSDSERLEDVTLLALKIEKDHMPRNSGGLELEQGKKRTLPIVSEKRADRRHLNISPVNAMLNFDTRSRWQICVVLSW